jgi:hypothetical protein
VTGLVGLRDDPSRNTTVPRLEGHQQRPARNPRRSRDRAVDEIPGPTAAGRADPVRGSGVPSRHAGAGQRGDGRGHAPGHGSAEVDLCDTARLRHASMPGRGAGSIPDRA